MTILMMIFKGLVILDTIAFALLVAGWPIWLRIVVNTDWFEDRCEELEDGLEITKEKTKKLLKRS